MGEPKEVRSPISRVGSRVGSHQPLSPGARSSPSRAADSIPGQRPNTASPVKSHSEPEPGGTTKVVGPEDD